MEAPALNHVSPQALRCATGWPVLEELYLESNGLSVSERSRGLLSISCLHLLALRKWSPLQTC